MKWEIKELQLSKDSVRIAYLDLIHNFLQRIQTDLVFY